MSKVSKVKILLKEWFVKTFTYKGVKVRTKTSLYATYLTKRKYQLMGVKDIKYNGEYPVVVDKANIEYCVVKVRLKKRNKVNAEQERNNYVQVTSALSDIEVPIKTILITEKANLLSDNLVYVKGLYDKETDKLKKKLLEEEYLYMKELNQYGETMEYKYIPYRDLEQVLEKLRIPYYLHVLDYDELLDFLFKVNNF